MYEIIKSAHMLLAVLTGAGLLARLILVALQSPKLNNRLLILGFMAVDISFIALGVLLAIMIPNKEITLANGWLIAKIIAWMGMFGAVLYGVKIAKQQPVRIAAICVGIVLYLYIMAVAHNHTPFPF